MDNKPILLLSAFTALLLIAAAATGSRYLASTNKPQPSPTPLAVETSTEAPSASVPLEGTTSVDRETLEAKVDFSRKIVTLTNPNQKEALEKTLASVGGTLLKQSDATTFVVQLSTDKLADQQKELAAIAEVETDYPAAVLTDTIDWGVERVLAPKVWDRTTGNNVKVAILDTGIDATHPDLAGTVEVSFDFTTDTTGGTDKHGHGTHVAGITASSKNDSGYIGASYQARLLAGKVLADDGTGYVSDIVEGITWAQQQGARVINMSLGTSYNSRVLKDAVERAASAGIVVVAAAGNTSGGAMTYPAAYSSVISVGATDSQNRLASFSAVGALVVAPGVAITSTLPGSRYATWSGTSMAAPHVAAAAALLIANGETNVRSKLTDSAVSVNGLKLINVETAVNGTDRLAPLISITNPKDGSIVSGTIQFATSATDESGIKEVVLTLDTTELQRFTSEPFEATFDTTTITDGSHTFYVSATDQVGNSGTVKVTFTVNNGLVSPTPTSDSSPSPSPTSNSRGNSNKDQKGPKNSKGQETQSEIDPTTLPTGTNADQRSQQAEVIDKNVRPNSSTPSQNQEKQQGKSRIERLFHLIFR